jgi:hypothetical protein
MKGAAVGEKRGGGEKWGSIGGWGSVLYSIAQKHCTFEYIAVVPAHALAPSVRLMG